MVEILSAIITRQAIRRSTHRSVRELVDAIGRFIDGWNDRCEPFVWTKSADEILTHARSGPRNLLHATPAPSATR